MIGPKLRPPPVITGLSVSNGTLSLWFEVGNPPDRYAVARCMDLRSNDWQTVARVFVTNGSARWRGTASREWGTAFWSVVGQ